MILKIVNKEDKEIYILKHIYFHCFSFNDGNI
jgi:hypothetical protein